MNAERNTLQEKRNVQKEETYSEMKNKYLYWFRLSRLALMYSEKGNYTKRREIL